VLITSQSRKLPACSLNAFFERNTSTPLPFQGLNAYLVGLFQDPKVAYAVKPYTLFSETNTVHEPNTDMAQAILSGLNASQQQAVTASDGPVMIIAGAGSGKTRTLMHRIAYILALRKAWPSQILALTFTNKAAREMRERIGKLVGEDKAKELWMGTFHSVFSRILRREADKIGYSQDFSIYDTDDAQGVIKGLMTAMAIDAKTVSPRAILHKISSAKNQLIRPSDYGRYVNGVVDEAASRLYQPYQDQLRRNNAMDFDDLLIKPIELFQQFPEVLTRYQERWKYLHIDEYQDTNHAQYVITRMLAAHHKNICVVGDDAQSIYAFRGADITNILDFQKDYPEATIVRLEQNYRSTKKILQLADSIIKKNKDQIDKTLWTDNTHGDDITLLEALSEKDEATKVEQNIRHIHLNYGLPYRSFAVLYRTNAQSRSLEDALRRGGLPYKIYGGINFYQRKEIKDAVAYLRLVVNPSDNESLKRVINYPTRGIGGKTMERVAEIAHKEGLAFWQVLEKLAELGFPPAAHQALDKFRFMIGKYAAKLNSTPAAELARELLAEAGLMQELRQENTVEALARWENVQELLNAIAEYEQEFTDDGNGNIVLSRFLQEVSLLTDADNDEGNDNKVTLMTLHASKGLEFPVVFLTGMEENLFPLPQAATDPKQLEEERRLFYVGITRAQEKLFLAFARTRFKYGKWEDALRSRFLDELDASVLKTEGGGRWSPQKATSIRATAAEAGRWRGGPTQGSSYRTPLADTPQKPLHRAVKPAPKPPEGRRVVYDDDYSAGRPIVPGQKVYHESFGTGKVIAIEGVGDQAKATVFFRDVGQKKLVLRFAKLQVVE